MNEVYSTFEREFGLIQDKFRFISISVGEARNSTERLLTNPGVYIYWKELDIVKVGRSFTNSRKRSLEHIRDNTRNEIIEMQSLESEEKCGIIYINCLDKEDYHWIAAIEIYLEKRLNPIIKSRRTG